MKKAIITLFLSVIFFFVSYAQSKQETAVADATEALRKAMVDADKTNLEKLTSEKLSYGHSGGHIDDKKEFVQKIVSGSSDFVSIDLTEQTISISGNTAIVRHILTGKTNDGGKSGEVHLRVLLVWEKKKNRWLLLARQAVKIT